MKITAAVSRPGLTEPTPMPVSDRYGGASAIYTDFSVPGVILPPDKLAYVYYSASGYDGFGGFQDPDVSGCIAMGNLRAKTGTTNDVASLGGYVTSKDGERIAFSFIYNGNNRWRAKEARCGF